MATRRYALGCSRSSAQRSSADSEVPKPGIASAPFGPSGSSMPCVSHQNISPSLCSQRCGMVRSAGLMRSPAAAGPLPSPLGPWQEAQFGPYSACPRAIEAAEKSGGRGLEAGRIGFHRQQRQRWPAQRRQPRPESPAPPAGTGATAATPPSARPTTPIAITLMTTSRRKSGSSFTVTRLNRQENGQTGVVCAAGGEDAMNAAAVTMARPTQVSTDNRCQQNGGVRWRPPLQGGPSARDG